jgi:hypothetical protein
MKRRILGFQRRVWWPKWTPASNSSAMPTWATVLSLYFFVLKMTTDLQRGPVVTTDVVTAGRATVGVGRLEVQ